MEEKDPAFHYVCTLDQARDLIGGRERFWVADCGCRMKREKCERSRSDVCLMFRAETPDFGPGKREISRADVKNIFREAEDRHLVPRPFRDEKNMTETDGICFCCDDCCEYFLEPDVHRCDKGEFVESTDSDACKNCGDCTEVCYFGARKLENAKLVLDEDACYGCGVCVGVCPEECIEMVSRGGQQ